MFDIRSVTKDQIDSRCVMMMMFPDILLFMFVCLMTVIALIAESNNINNSNNDNKGFHTKNLSF